MAGRGRREDQRFLTGRGRYVDDIRCDGALVLKLLRSPIAHGRIASIGTSVASSVPGVVAIVTARDIREARLGTLPTAWSPPGRNGSVMAAPPRPLLADELVRHVGEPVAAVIAETETAALLALDLIEVEYQPLPAVTAGASALEPGAPVLHPAEAPGNLCLDFELGDRSGCRRAMGSARHVIELEIASNRLAVCPLEPRAALAEPDPQTGGVTLHATTQIPHSIRSLLAVVLRLPDTLVRVISPDVGGGFGGKMALYAEDVLAAWLAIRQGRPVRWTSTRSEAFLSDTQARDHTTGARLGLDQEGRILALEVETVANVGAYLSLAAPAIPTWYYAPLLTGAYRVPVAHAGVRLAFTNTQAVDAYRGAGRPEATYVIERLMDEAAHRLGVGPDEIRRRNLLRPQDYPVATALGLSIDCGDHPGMLARALAVADWAGFPARRAHALSRGRHRGIGLSTYVEIAGGSPSHVLASQGARGGSYEAARVHVLPSGGVVLAVGTHNHGQSHETVLTRLLADRLGIDPASIRFVQGDTDTAPIGRGTFASRSLALAGSAIHGAAERIVVKMRAIAAELIEAGPDDIVLANGHLLVRGTDRGIAFAEVARAAYRLPARLLGQIAPGLDETAFVEPPDWTYPGGCHVCEVEVDPSTGEVELIAVTAVDDVGTVIDHTVVEGQIHGGLAQGIGQALLEEVVHDPETGQLLSGSFLDYALPRACDLVAFSTQTHPVPTARNPLGVKGCAEAGTVGVPPAVINAIIDALRPLGVTDIQMPATPFRVWQAIRAAAQSETM